MRITELIENKNFNDLQYVEKTTEGNQINFDLPEDVIHFMHNNDEAYRRHLYPIIARCNHLQKKNFKTKPSILKPAVDECYKSYLKEYPIRELPTTLNKETLDKICEKLHEEIYQHIADGKYGE